MHGKHTTTTTQTETQTDRQTDTTTTTLSHSSRHVVQHTHTQTNTHTYLLLSFRRERRMEQFCALRESTTEISRFFDLSPLAVSRALVPCLRWYAEKMRSNSSRSITSYTSSSCRSGQTESRSFGGGIFDQLRDLSCTEDAGGFLGGRAAAARACACVRGEDRSRENGGGGNAISTDR